MKNIRYLTILIGLALFMSCSGSSSESEETADSTETMMTPQPTEASYDAIADISPASGSQVMGAVKFTDMGNGSVNIEVEISGLTPGDHALHLHQNGDCSAADGSSAGGHWNPTNMPHGKRGGGQYHKGDIANITAGADGKVSWSDTVVGWTVGGADSTNILNKAVIIHSGADDFTSQPSGNAGSRVACGVITEVGAM